MILPVLKTERLVLRPPACSDADRVVKLVGNYEVACMLSVVPHPYDTDDALWWINQTAAFADGGVRSMMAAAWSELFRLGAPGSTPIWATGLASPIGARDG